MLISKELKQFYIGSHMFFRCYVAHGNGDMASPPVVPAFSSDLNGRRDEITLYEGLGHYASRCRGWIYTGIWVDIDFIGCVRAC